MKKNILFFMLGLIVSGSIGVYATIKLQANEIGYKETTVEEALDSLYSNVATKKFCELKSGTALIVGANYECDPGDGIKRNFYVLAVDNNKVKLIMEHNITEGTAYTTMTWMNAMDFFSNSSIAGGLGTKTKNEWINVLDIDLPMAQDIANAVGNTGWNMEDKNYDGWFCFGTGYNQTCGDNSGALKNDSQTLKYNWLFNYTRECENSGCTASTSLGAGEAYGYWTRDIVAQQKDSTGRAWIVHENGDLGFNTVSNSTHDGVRPVITVLKSNLVG